MLIGRENEIKELMEKYNSLESSFVAIYSSNFAYKNVSFNHCFINVNRYV